MKNTKTIKVLIAMLSFAIIITMAASVFAYTIGNVTINETVDDTAKTTATDIGNRIAGILQVVGIVISVVVIMVLGIKYMMGSAEEKAEYKKTFVPYIIGAVLLFGASAFAKQIYQFASSLKLS